MSDELNTSDGTAVEHSVDSSIGGESEGSGGAAEATSAPPAPDTAPAVPDAAPAVQVGAVPAMSTPPQAPPPPAPIPVAPSVPRSPVGFQPAEQGWWQATDGLWYPPESFPSGAPSPAIVSPGSGSQNIIINMANPAPAQYVGPPKSKVVAFLLAFFLGTLGVQRFYLGHVVSGVVMLVLSLTFFGLIITVPWALIDCILILAGGLKSRDGRALT